MLASNRIAEEVGGIESRITATASGLYQPTILTRDERGWRIGIARPGGLGMRWGLMTFPVPEAAALHACRVVKDDSLRDRIWESMQANDDDHKRRTKDALNRFILKEKR